MKRAQRLWACVSLMVGSLGLAATAWADNSVDPLVDFFADFQTLHAEFSQSQFDERRGLIQEMSGTVSIERPGRFRWDYRLPYEQHIVADGSKVWLYDVDLEQVTVKAQSQTLGDTPAELLSSRRALMEKFKINAVADERDGLQWYDLEPLAGDTGFERLALGMRGGVLRRMEFQDGFGQYTELRFDKVQINQHLEASRFQFTPPAGVDVIDETLP